MFKYTLFSTLFGILIFYQFHGCIAQDASLPTAGNGSSVAAPAAPASGEFGSECDNTTKACDANKNLSCHTKLDPANNVSLIFGKCMCRPASYRKNDTCVQANFTKLPPDPAAAYGILPTLRLHHLLILTVLAFLTTSLLF